MQIEDYLYGKKLHLPLLGGKPATMKDEEWAFLDRHILGVIKLSLSRFVAHKVIKEKTTVDLMKVLSGMYEKPSTNNKVHLMKKLFNLKMAKNASVAQHLRCQIHLIKITCNIVLYDFLVWSGMKRNS